MHKRGIMFAVLAGLASTVSAQPSAAPAPPAPAAPAAAAIVAPPDYSRDDAWLCLPGRRDACSTALPTAALEPRGYGAVATHRVAADAPVDCFYVYPTVSRDPGLNSDLNPGQTEEQGAALVQFSRFAEVCRPFAPIYRSVTVAGIPAAARGEDVRPIFDLAYRDVRTAWRQFLASRSNDRPFVLIGHSQGSIHLVRLMQEEIDGRPIARRMVSALLIGWNVEVPTGRAVGGTFRTTPLCTRAGQTGCVVTYVSYRAETPPPPGAQFGRADIPNFGRPPRPGMTVGCTHPRTLAAGSAPLDSVWFVQQFAAGGGGQPIAWSSAGAPPTPFVRTQGLVSGECVNRGALGYLAVTVNADPADARTDRIPGDVYMGGQLNPGWGLHVADIALAQDDLIRLVAAQSAAFTGARRGRR